MCTVDKGKKGDGAIMELYRWVFLSFLLAAAWQDLQEKSVSVWLYAGYGIAVCVIRAVNGDWSPAAIGGIWVGAAMLLIGRLTRGAVGSGDGWFFIIASLYLSVPETIRLLLNGGLVCGMSCLILVVIGGIRGRNMRRVTIPFLPFLVPVWIWMVIS